MKSEKRILKGLLYIIASIAFVAIFSTSVNRLMDFGSGQLGFTHLGLFIRWLSGFLFTLMVSIIFSLEHLKSLFFQRDRKLQIKYARFIVALFFAVLSMPPIFDLHAQFIHLVFGFGFFHGQIFQFALFYNLIRAFNRSEQTSQ